MSAAAPAEGSALAKGERRLFDDRSRQLDRFGPLLVLTVVVVGTLSLVDLRGPAEEAWRQIALAAVGLLTGVTLLLALRASGIAHRWRVAADIVYGLAAAGTLVGLVIVLATDADPRVFSSDRPSPVWVAIAVVTPIAVIRRLVRHRRVTAGTMYGAVAAYLLIGLAYCYLFLLVDGVQSEPFFGTGADEATPSFMYFSLSSITTVGYGDLAAATDLGRLLATSEAVTGQVYLVTFVAMLVGLLIRQRDDGRA